MNPTARVRANRRNAKLSTGPRSKTGKARVARNAIRHTLAVPIASVEGADATIEQIARRLAGEDAHPDRLELSRRIAEAQVDLKRVRRARAALIAEPMANADYLPIELLEVRVIAGMKKLARRKRSWSLEDLSETIYPMPPAPTGEAERIAAIIRHLSSDLARLDRYERRALSRRKFAIRALDALRPRTI